jgi:anti-sigma regulatory factor (Ser/Thr protein kinase)
MRRELIDVLHRNEVAPARRAGIALVFHEAAANVVVHAYPAERVGPLYASAALTGRGLTIAIIDQGRGLGSPSAHTGCGFGFSLMERLSDELWVQSNDPDVGTSVCAGFEGVVQEPAMLRGAVVARDRAAMAREYFRALQAAHVSLQEETGAVLAEAAQALAHARRCRRAPVRSRSTG